MKTKAFYEVLEDQIRSDLRKEIEAEVRARLADEFRKSGSPNQDPTPDTENGTNNGTRNKATAFERLETWLASHVQRPAFASNARASQTYHAGYAGSKANRPRTEAQNEAAAHTDHKNPTVKESRTEPVYEVKTVEELCALELLRRHGAQVDNRFTASELKTAWRKAALKTHPDRFMTSDAATQAKMAATFREISEAYDRLQSAFDTPLAA